MVSSKGEENDLQRLTPEAALASQCWHTELIARLVPEEGLSLSEVARLDVQAQYRVLIIMVAMGMPIDQVLQFAEVEVARAIRMVRVAEYVRDSRWDRWADKWMSGEDKSVSVAWELGRSSWGIMQDSANSVVELFYAKKENGDLLWHRERAAWATILSARATDGEVALLLRLLAFLKQDRMTDPKVAKTDLTPRS